MEKNINHSLIKKEFTSIYKNNEFGSLESKSGPGSTLEETVELRQRLVDIIEKYNIKSIVDVPCGDWNWMREIADKLEHYIGGDIVEECVLDNKRKYGTENINFINFNLLIDTLPKADLLLVRDVIGHYPLYEGKIILENILNSECKYFLSTTTLNVIRGGDFSNYKNKEIEYYGRHYMVNLLSEPFNFPEPLEYILEPPWIDMYDDGERKVLALWDLEKVRNAMNEPNYLENKLKKLEIKSKTIEINKNLNVNKNLTIVTGLWDIGRVGRDFSHYIEHFERFLDIPQNLFIYIPKEYEYLVWRKRSRANTFVKVYEIDDVKKLYEPFWNKTQEIRNNPEWYNQVSWLPGSPQASLEMYNPIVQSKMFMLHDACIWNPFNSEYFFWLDAGITNTVPYTHLTENNVLDKLTEYGNPFLFLSYPYEAETEIHGFTFNEMNRIAGTKVEYVCRGGLFGGHKEQLHQANATYYSLLANTLNKGFMGTEESIFSLMTYNEPNIYGRYELDGNGLIVKFTQAIIDNNVKIERLILNENQNVIKYTDNSLKDYKTNLYILTFNFPEQVLHTINSMKKTPEWLNIPHLVLLDNSTDNLAKEKNKEIAKEHNFEYIDLITNTGICGGRQAAAEHFHKSDADFMFFFEDDMTVNPPEYGGQFCRNGFRKYIPNLYNIVHRIMLKENFDFLKLTFTEVYFDNDKQCSWYNVPQHIRTRDWPHYDKLPVSGLDPNVPLTNFKNIRNLDGVCYIDGEIYYANWPMIVSKKGNKKMFIDTKWAHPYEQTWMSHMYQLTKENKLNPAVLLAAPIWHDRIMHYKPEDRREN